MTAKEKILKAKVQLILSQPFFATLMLKMAIIEDLNIETASTNGVNIKYNPSFIETLNIDEVKGLLCHEILHVAMNHTTRRNGRTMKDWNAACDFAINPLVEKSGMQLPPNGLLDSEYENMSAENIYKLIGSKKGEDQNNNQQQQGNGQQQGNNGKGQDQSNFGNVEDSPAQTEGEKQEIEAKVKQSVAQAAQIAKKQGKLPAYLQRLVDEILEPKVNWKEVINRFVSDLAKNDYTFKKPNPRYLQSGFFLPSLQNEEPGKIIFIVDTSISMDKQALNQSGSELHDACNTMGSTLTVIYVDTEVKGVQEIEPDENIKLNPIGGGGTDFRPGFELIDKEDMNPKAVIYLTDGRCNRFPEVPEYPVLWIKYGNYDFKPSFGEVINI